MKKHTALKDVFSASLNLQMSHVDKESYERFTKTIEHSQKTTGILLTSGIVLIVICSFLRTREVDLFSYIPGVLFLFLYARYKDLNKQALAGIKNLKKQSEPVE